MILTIKCFFKLKDLTLTLNTNIIFKKPLFFFYYLINHVNFNIHTYIYLNKYINFKKYNYLFIFKKINKTTKLNKLK